MEIFGYEFIFRKKPKQIYFVFENIKPKKFRIEKVIKDGYFITRVYRGTDFIKSWIISLPATQEEIDCILEKTNKYVNELEQLKF